MLGVERRSTTATHFAATVSIQNDVAPSATLTTLFGYNGSVTWSVTGANSGRTAGVAFGGFPNLTGGAGNDTFVFAPGGSLTGSLDGGGGANWLDYGAYTSGVAVNFATGMATSVGGAVASVNNEKTPGLL